MLLRSGLRIAASSRCLSTSAGLSAAVNQLTVIGGGLMGSGIAQVAAQSGINVTLVDVDDKTVQKSIGIIRNSLPRVAKKKYASDPQAAEKFVKDTLSRIQPETDAKKGVAKADLVIEAIIENLEIKQKLFADLDKAAPKNTIFASNTSSLIVSEIAQLTNRKDRFGGLHFFNPVPVMKLLEIIRIPETSDDTYNTLVEFGKKIDKVTVTCKDTPMFIVNRLLFAYQTQAYQLLERGDATARDIDLAMKLGAGYPMGPFELSDYVGLDTSLFIMEGWHKRFPDNPMFKPPEILRKLVKEGKLGRKSGEGFYKYNS